MMDTLDTMTATDWRRVYERSQEHAVSLLKQGVAMRRREAELVDRLRRREERVRKLEEENQRMRDDLDAANGFVMGALNGDWINLEAWGGDRWQITRDGTKVAFVRGRDAALSRAREIAGEET